MADSAITRAVRALDLIPYILENPGNSVEQLANKFETSSKQIISDLEVIFMCGLPGYTPYELIDLSFEDGIVTVVDAQVLDKPRKFTETEAVIVSLGLQLLSNLAENIESKDRISKLIEKLSSKFKATSQIELSLSNKPTHYDAVIHAITAKSNIEFSYKSLSKDEFTNRTVSPIRIYTSGGVYYLSAFDLNNNGLRVFRIDLMSDIQLISGVYKTGESPIFIQTIEFEIESTNELFLEKYSSIFNEVTKTKTGFNAKGLVSNREWLFRLLLSNRAEVTVIKPQDLADDLIDRAGKIVDLYADSSNN